MIILHNMADCWIIDIIRHDIVGMTPEKRLLTFENCYTIVSL
jgi:hypothetical protein